MAVGRYNVGVIGYGLSAKIFHIPFVNAVPEFNLYAIVQRSPKANDDASKDHPNIKLYHSVDEMVKDEQVHVVVVTTPPESHYPLAKMALQARKHGILRWTSAPPATHVLMVTSRRGEAFHAHLYRSAGAGGPRQNPGSASHRVPE